MSVENMDKDEMPRQNWLTSLEEEKVAQTLQFMLNRASSTIGCIVIFNVDHDSEKDAKSLAIKLIRLSNNPLPPSFSYEGEEVHQNPTLVDDLTPVKYQDINFSFVDKTFFEQTFLIVLLSGIGEQDQRAYAYINVRLDRVDEFLNVFGGDTLRNAYDYCTVIQTGLGEPLEEVTQKFQSDYLFGSKVINVRFFKKSTNNY